MEEAYKEMVKSASSAISLMVANGINQEYVENAIGAIYEGMRANGLDAKFTLSKFIKDIHDYITSI